MALAQAIIEYIHDRTRAKTLFATHYHELTDLSKSLTRLENVHVATLERDGQVTFLHKIEAGPADKSYGIHVAKIAGLPTDLLRRADAILTDLEGREDQKAIFDSDKSQDTLLRQDPMGQLDLFTAEHPVLETLRGLNLNQMTPMDALLLLSDLQKDL